MSLPAEPGLAVRGVRFLARYRCTLLILLALVIAALWTDSHVGPLAKGWLSRLGFAPRDLGAGRLGRLLLSALLTHGGGTFWRALAMVALLVGACERRIGSWRTAATFWGVHVLVLLTLSTVILLQMRWTGSTLLGPLPLPRDVGPSAGAFACLGVAVALASKPWRRTLGVGLWAAMLAALVLPPLAEVPPTVDLSADLAHLLAFGGGWLVAVGVFRSVEGDYGKKRVFRAS